MKSFLMGLVLLGLYGTQALASGAIAIGPQGAWGIAHDQPSMQQARNVAMAKCPGKCKVVLTFPTGCGAYAVDQVTGGTAYGWAKAPNKQEARFYSIDNCHKAGGESCDILAWACNAH